MKEHPQGRAGLLLATSAAASASPKGEILVLLSSETELPLQGGKSLTTGYQNELGCLPPPCWRPVIP